MIIGMISGGCVFALSAYTIVLTIVALFIAPMILCRHCPFYKEQGWFLKCPAHYGSIKLLKFSDKPLMTFEKISVVALFILMFGYPIPFLIISQQYLWLLMSSYAIIMWVFTMRRYICSTCVNFSCPLNVVSSETRESYEQSKVQLHNCKYL
jgi:hypothetical protein